MNRRPDATERLIPFLIPSKQQDKKDEKTDEWRNGTVEERINHALIKGIVDYIEQDVLEARDRYARGPFRSSKDP